MSIQLTLPENHRKRKRHTRVTTGCRACRQARVKCPEGGDTAQGKRIKCKRCWEGDVACFYPSTASGKGRRLTDDGWTQAEEVEEWREKACCSPARTQVVFRQPTPEQATLTNLGAGASMGTPAFDWESFLSTAIDHSIQDQLPSFPLPGTSSSTGHLTEISEHNLIDFTLSTPTPIVTVPQCSHSSDPFPLAPHKASASVLGISPQVLHRALNPSPARMLNTFTLASFSSTSGDQTAVSYFESQGCNEIVAAPKSKHNWIFTELFPRLFALFSLASGTVPARGEVDHTIRQWLHHCLLQLSFVHRANVESDDTRALYWRTEADKHRQMASYQVLRAKVRFTQNSWKTEEYLMGFFVRCMADMLNAKSLVIDRSTAFELPTENSSPFYPSLRDMISLYSTIQYACTPLDNTTSPFVPAFPISPSGPEWVEQFVGFSRRIIALLGRVTGMVAQRAALLRSGTDETAPGKLLRAQAERLVVELGDSWNWDESVQDLGKSNRVQRGSEVMRSALQVMLLTEVMHVDLDDSRIIAARERVIELVADSEPTGMGGYQWSLTIIAVYTRDVQHRQRLQRMLELALAMSFGSNYKGTSEILTLCWEVLDNNGGFENGIAPWREAMTAFGRSLFV